MSGSQQQVPNEQMLTVSLQAQEWQVVFAALNEMPMRVSRPTYDRILQQLQLEIAAAQNAPPSMAQRGNGEATEAPYSRA